MCRALFHGPGLLSLPPSCLPTTADCNAAPGSPDTFLCMRLPHSKPWRAFEAFDHVPEDECRRLVRQMVANLPRWVGLLPWCAGVLAFVAVPVALVVFSQIPSTARWVPSLGSLEADGVALVIIAVASTALSALATRDLIILVGLRRMLRKASCPKCGYSLVGVKLTTRGVDPDPAKTEVKCPECGRTWVLLDIGLTPRDLISWEERARIEQAGTLRPLPRAQPQRVEP